MPYSSRTGKKVSSTWKPKSIKNELAALKRQVAKNSPAPAYFNVTRTAIGSGATGTGSYVTPDDYSLTDLFIADSSFRNIINGDQWYNCSLAVTGVLDSQCECMRITVYSPRVAGNAPVLTTGSLGAFHQTFDPAAFKVIDDRVLNRSTNALESFRYWVNLRSLKTIYNDSASGDPIEQGEVRIVIQAYMANTAVTTNTQVRNFLTVKDK